jgi:hypothetical protein
LYDALPEGFNPGAFAAQMVKSATGNYPVAGFAVYSTETDAAGQSAGFKNDDLDPGEIISKLSSGKGIQTDATTDVAVVVGERFMTKHRPAPPIHLSCVLAQRRTKAISSKGSASASNK